MKNEINNPLLRILVFALTLGKAQCGFCQKNLQYDIVIYGGTSAGVSAAIQGSRMGKKVVLIEPTQRIGGLTTGGLGQTDIGNKQAIGGISREFYQNVRKYYQNPNNWKFQKRETYRDGGQTQTLANEDAMWTFEPSAALKILKEMLGQEKNITVVYSQQLNRKNDPVGLAAYGMDSHNTQRYVTKEGFVKNEGNVEASVKGPFAISYRAIIPKKGTCQNLLVPVCLSATHIAFGSIRMEPVFMVLGQSAATAAALAIENKVSPQKLSYEKLREVLLKDKQILDK